MAGLVATHRPMSSSTASSVVADNQIVPGDQACSFDLVYCEGRHQPHVELVAHLADGCLGDGGGHNGVGAQRQVRAVLLDGTERLHDDAALVEPLAHLWTGEIWEVPRGRCHTGTLPAPATGQNDPMSPPDYDAMVVGAGHNGLVCAAYLAKAGLRTLLVEARSSVGGTASSESFAGGTVNICNCDHITFRTTPVIDELGLAGFGLRYIDIDPAQRNMVWEGGAVVDDPPRRRADHRLARPHLSRRGRRLPALPARRDAGRADGVRQCQRPALGQGDRQEGASPDAGEVQRHCCGGAAAAPPT